MNILENCKTVFSFIEIGKRLDEVNGYDVYMMINTIDC